MNVILEVRFSGSQARINFFLTFYFFLQNLSPVRNSISSVRKGYVYLSIGYAMGQQIVPTIKMKNSVVSFFQQKKIIINHCGDGGVGWVNFCVAFS